MDEDAIRREEGEDENLTNQRSETKFPPANASSFPFLQATIQNLEGEGYNSTIHECRWS